MFKKVEEIPIEILEDFEYAERRLEEEINKNGNQKIKPEKIFEEIRNKRRRKITRDSSRREQEITKRNREYESNNIPEKPRRKGDIQDRIIENIDSNKGSPRKFKRNRKRNFIRRIRRR